MAPGRLDEYIMFLNSLNTKFDLLVFSETWLTPDNFELCKIVGYQAVHLVRTSNVNSECKSRGVGFPFLFVMLCLLNTVWILI